MFYPNLKKMFNNYIIVPPYHEWTSFDDLVRSMKISISKNNLPIKIIEIQRDTYENKKIWDHLFDNNADIIGRVDYLKKMCMEYDIWEKYLFLDFFSPGLDVFIYNLEICGKAKPKLGSLLHGWSFVPRDLYQWSWLKKSELLRFEIFDNIYVPSKYLKSLVPKKHKKKISVFPRWLDHIETKNSQLPPIYDVIFPHRLSDDKWIDEFLSIVESNKNIKFAVCIPSYSDSWYIEKIKNHNNIIILEWEDNTNHLKSMQQSTVVLSCAYQENFWFAIHKAISMWCVPVLPNRAVYPEFFLQIICIIQ